MPRSVGISEAASLALHTMAILAARPKERLTTHDLAERLRASAHHLAKVMQRLAKAGLVHSVRGPQGGFQLERPAKTTRLRDVYEAVEGPMDEVGCLLGEPICEGEECVLGEAIHSIHEHLRDYLERTTVADLAAGFCQDRAAGPSVPS